MNCDLIVASENESERAVLDLVWEVKYSAPPTSSACPRTSLHPRCVLVSVPPLLLMPRARGDSCDVCRKAHKLCNGSVPGCQKNRSVLDEAAAAAAAAAAAPDTPAARASQRQKTTPGGTTHRGAPAHLSEEKRYSPEERLRNRSSRCRHLRQLSRRAQASAQSVEELLDHADWTSVGEEAPQSLLSGASLNKVQLDGRLYELLILAAADVPQHAPLALQLESVQCNLASAADSVNTQRGSRRQASLPPVEHSMPPPSVTALFDIIR